MANCCLIILPMLLGVAFITLIERKFIGARQIRKGPQKVGALGGLQPFRDALKLLRKEIFFMVYGNKKIYYFIPLLNLFFVGLL